MMMMMMMMILESAQSQSVSQSDNGDVLLFIVDTQTYREKRAAWHDIERKKEYKKLLLFRVQK